MGNFSTKGIGWLIFGALVCAAAFPSSDISDLIGMLLIGVTFIAVYLIKQRFDPSGIGWFIAGGIMTAFTVQTLLEVVFRLDYTSDISTVLIGLIVACVCFFMFYRKNQEDIDDVVEDMEEDQLARYEAKERAVRGPSAESKADIDDDEKLELYMEEVQAQEEEDAEDVEFELEP